MPGTTPIKHFLQFSDFTLDEFEHVIQRAAIIKRKFKAYEVYHPLVDRTLVMVFEKSSTRTRLSFEAGMHQLGGAAIYLTDGRSATQRAADDGWRDTVLFDLVLEPGKAARIALGGVATKPWRARLAEQGLAGRELTIETALAAGFAAFADARTGHHNAFRIELGARTVADALLTAAQRT